MENDREHRIRERAYALWEQEGRPQGDDLRHWLAALEEFGSESLTEETITENTSVFGEPDTTGGVSDVPPQQGKASAKAGKSKAVPSRPASSKITTGRENTHSAVKGAEGP